MHDNLCPCGCGLPPNPGKTWVRGHGRRGVGGFGYTRNTKQLAAPQNLCACGCGTLVYKMFAPGHWSRVRATDPRIRQRKDDQKTQLLMRKTTIIEVPGGPGGKVVIVGGTLAGAVGMQNAPVTWDDPYALLDPDEGSMALIRDDLRRAGYVNVSYHPHRDPFPIAEAIELMVEHEAEKLEDLTEPELREYSRTMNKRILTGARQREQAVKQHEKALQVAQMRRRQG